jgi:hypothetical protein
MVAFALAVAIGFLQGVPASQSTRGRVAVTVDPEIVRVGEPVTMIVRVTVPQGTRLRFPAAVDSTAVVEPLDPVVVREEARDGLTEATATYRLLAWEPGNAAVPIGPIEIERDGRTQTLAIPAPRLSVESVLPPDSASRVPKPARDIIAFPVTQWLAWALAVIGVVIVALAVWALRRRGKRPPPPIEPFADAQRAFGRLAALDLIGAGEPGKHVATAADVVRDFLGARNPRVARGLTTGEIVAIVRDDESVPVWRVEALLSTSDEVKFAHGAIDAPAAEAFTSEAQAIVATTHRADLQRAKTR